LDEVCGKYVEQNRHILNSKTKQEKEMSKTKLQIQCKKFIIERVFNDKYNFILFTTIFY